MGDRVAEDAKNAGGTANVHEFCHALTYISLAFCL
jgi:hypothetical protein